jgi:hypothetical protein
MFELRPQKWLSLRCLEHFSAVSALEPIPIQRRARRDHRENPSIRKSRIVGDNRLDDRTEQKISRCEPEPKTKKSLRFPHITRSSSSANNLRNTQNNPSPTRKSAETTHHSTRQRRPLVPPRRYVTFNLGDSFTSPHA